jgi:hypothetical protein
VGRPGPVGRVLAWPLGHAIMLARFATPRLGEPPGVRMPSARQSQEHQRDDQPRTCERSKPGTRREQLPGGATTPRLAQQRCSWHRCTCSLPTLRLRIHTALRKLAPAGLHAANQASA